MYKGLDTLGGAIRNTIKGAGQELGYLGSKVKQGIGGTLRRIFPKKPKVITPTATSTPLNSAIDSKIGKAVLGPSIGGFIQRARDQAQEIDSY